MKGARLSPCRNAVLGEGAEKIIKILPRAEYEWEEESGQCTLLAEQVCPYCGCKLWRHGTRSRKYRSGEGIQNEAIILRMRCSNEECGRVHHLLPEGFLPYKRYLGSTVEEALRAAEDPKNAPACDACEQSTITRWRRWLRLRQKSIETAAQSAAFCGRCRVPLYPLSLQKPGWLTSAVMHAVNDTGRCI